MPTTTENLKEAFAGESQAHQKYLAFAAQAEKEGFATVARLFRVTAEAERLHAAGHLQAMEGLGNTADNLEEAIGGETHEYRDMYPPMLEQAEMEGHHAKRMFGYAVKAEAVHAQLYTLALRAVKNGDDLAETRFYLCPVCGHIELDGAPDRCPICQAPAARFQRV